MTDARATRRPGWIGWTIAAIVVVLLSAVGWVAARGIGAANDLQQVRAHALQLRSALMDGDLDGARQHSDDLSARAASAHALTSDPIWRAFEFAPWAGANLTAVREMSGVADDIGRHALPPLLEAAGALDLNALGLHDGAIDLAPFTRAEKPLSAASEALALTDRQASAIDASAVLPQLASAVFELRDAVTEASTAVGGLHGAAALLPGMLGADGPRHYVIAMQNNAELRSSGGIIGALALVRAEHGTLSIVGQAAASDFPRREPSAELSDSTIGLFGDGPGRFVQNITSIPDFSEAAPLLADRWQEHFGTSIDGVLTIDAVVARDLLAVTGPQQVGPFTLDRDNVLRVLLSEVYRDIRDPKAQDAVFAQVASVLFDAALHVDRPRALLSALTTSADDNRIRLWSAHGEEQRQIAQTTVSGVLPDDSPDQAHVGVLLNDVTAGKMDYYARAEISTAMGRCDGAPTTRVRITLTSAAPADAATSLPPYVTGNGYAGVPLGDMRTLVAVYGPQGALPVRMDRDGTEEKVQVADLDGRIAVQHDVLLGPGDSSTITVDYTGGTSGADRTVVQHTPMTTSPEIHSETLDCGS